jgi:DNA-binding NarL/FixJ family response regulator
MKAQEKYKIIIAEDNPEFAKGLKYLLSTYGQYEVLDIVSDGAKIVKHDLLNVTDLILMDVNMPLLNGIEAGKQIDFLFPRIRQIAITFNKDQVFLEELIAAGFRGFVDKQAIFEELEGVLNTVMNNQYAFPKNMLITSGRS